MRVKSGILLIKLELFIFTFHNGEKIQTGVVINEREKVCEAV